MPVAFGPLSGPLHLRRSKLPRSPLASETQTTPCESMSPPRGPKPGGGTGDLYYTTRVTLPDGNDAELEALMEKWRDSKPYNPRSDLDR